MRGQSFFNLLGYGFTDRDEKPAGGGADREKDKEAVSDGKTADFRDPFPDGEPLPGEAF